MVLVDPSVNKTNRLKPKQGSFTSPINVSNGLKIMDMFYIDHTEVTVKQYKKTHPTHDQTYITEKTCLACPAMGIAWVNADKHCRAVGKRLPTEAEWELAAGGSSKKPTYWSNKTKRSFANLVEEKDGFASVAPVGSFPLGSGPFGTLDMIGNVWEWVDTPHSPLPKNLRSKKKGTYRIAKGGSWTSPLGFATVDYRNVVAGNIKNPTFGFRCVKSIN
jgi:formylglycine-generating enzyme required for sulfatase activity